MMPGIRFAVLFGLGLTLRASTVDDGIAAFRDGRYSVALAKLKSASGNSTARAFLGLTEAALNDCPAALPKLTDVNDSTTDLYRLANLAAVKCYSSSGNEAKAFSVLNELERKFPNDADVLYLKAKLHMRAFNDTTFTMFQRVPGSYRVHELSAEIFEVQNRYSEAAEEYRKATAINPSAPDLHFRLGRALLMQNHESASLDQAAEEFRAELKLNPEDGACEYQLGQIAQVKGQSTEAKEHFARAVTLSPNFVQALIALGKIHTQEKKWPQAISLLSRATALQPANETAHYALLTAYRDSGDIERSRVEKAKLDTLQKPPAGEFSDFLKKLGEKKPEQ